MTFHKSDINAKGESSNRNGSEQRQRSKVLDSKKRSKIIWTLPFFVSGCMAFGTLFGFLMLSEAASQRISESDQAGAASAVMILICLVVGFVMSALTLIAAKLLHRGTPNHIVLRLVLSLFGGAVIKALGFSPESVPTAAVWIVAFSVPVLVVWPWRKSVAEPKQID